MIDVVDSGPLRRGRDQIIALFNAVLVRKGQTRQVCGRTQIVHVFFEVLQLADVIKIQRVQHQKVCLGPPVGVHLPGGLTFQRLKEFSKTHPLIGILAPQSRVDLASKMGVAYLVGVGGYDAAHRVTDDGKPIEWLLVLKGAQVAARDRVEGWNRQFLMNFGDVKRGFALMNAFKIKLH